MTEFEDKIPEEPHGHYPHHFTCIGCHMDHTAIALDDSHIEFLDWLLGTYRQITEEHIDELRGKKDKESRQERKSALYDLEMVDELTDMIKDEEHICDDCQSKTKHKEDDDSNSVTTTETGG